MWTYSKSGKNNYLFYDSGCGCCSDSYSFDLGRKTVRKTARSEINEIINDLEETLKIAKEVKDHLYGLPRQLPKQRS